jgi:hypothetical protein
MLHQTKWSQESGKNILAQNASDLGALHGHSKYEANFEAGRRDNEIGAILGKEGPHAPKLVAGSP